MLFIDFREAFDSIQRGLIMKIFKSLAKVETYDIPDRYRCYGRWNTGAYVFIIVIDYVMRKCKEGKEFDITLQLYNRDAVEDIL